MAVSYPKIKLLQLSYNEDTTRGGLLSPTTKNEPQASAFKVGVQKKTKKKQDDQFFNNYMSIISDHNHTNAFNEESWKDTMTSYKDHCLTPSSGRSSGPSNNSTHSQEEKMWLTYLPRQQKQGNEFGNEKRWDTYSRFSEDYSKETDKLNKLNSQEKRQAEWDSKMLGQFQKRNQLRSQRQKSQELAFTLNRYKDFTKTILGNLKETEMATKNLSYGRYPKYQASEVERIVNGYNILKDLYAMNPELVIQLASQHKTAGPGKRWMGLSRDDITEVLRHLAKGRDDPNYSPYPGVKKTFGGRDPHTGAYSLHDYLSSSKISCPSSKINFLNSKIPSLSNMCKLPVAPRQPQVILRKVRCANINNKRPLKPRQLMPLHIPGPARLHQNVCVRPYSAEMDGPDSDIDFEGQNEEKKSRAKVRVRRALNQVRAMIASEGDQSVDFSTELGDESEEVETLTLDFESGEEDEGITIESFIPCFKSAYQSAI